MRLTAGPGEWWRRALCRVSSGGALLLFAGAAGARPVASALDGQLRVSAARVERAQKRAAPMSPALVPCFIESSDVSATRRRVRVLGGRVGTVVGQVMTAALPATALLELGSDPSVRRAEAAPRVRPRLDKVAEILGVPAIHEGQAPLSGAYRGRGVVVGVVDLGLDLAHPAFSTRAGQSRVVALWDPSGGGPPPPGGVGTYCSEDDLARDMCSLALSSEHGTHVTGIAAGSSVPNVPFVGIAPEADIVFVNLGALEDDGGDFAAQFGTTVCDAVAFVFSVAEARGEPAVVNLSVGSHVGPHDGSSLAVECLNGLAGPGRIIVAAAGNEGAPLPATNGELLYVHARGDAQEAPVRVPFVVGEAVAAGSLLEVWFDDHDAATFTLSVAVPTGERQVSEPVGLDDQVRETRFDLGGHSLGPVYLASTEAPSGSRAFQLLVLDEDGDGAEQAATWQLELASLGPFDGYLDINGGGGFLDHQLEGGAVVDSQKSVGFPAVATNVIAVGSSVSRNTWQLASGDLIQVVDVLTGEPPRVGTLSPFSSRGPTRDPARTGPKPDFVAPGELVVSALAAPARADLDPDFVVREPPAGYLVLAGTSQSSPAVAGVVALMLERDPSLGPAAVRDLLRAGAVAPAGVSLPSTDWGYGRVDARASLLATPEHNPGQPPVVEGEGGCHCSLVDRRGGAGWMGLALALAIGVSRRRRRFGTAVRWPER